MTFTPGTTGWLIAEGFFGDELFPAHRLTVLLWAGLAVLTVALLVLMQTRWGQAKPLSKCVALSVFAHVLLMTYAYGTKLILDQPAEQAEPFIRVAILEADQPAEWPAEEDVAQRREPWNQFASELVAAPTIETPGRREAQLADQPLDWSVPDLEFAAEVEAADVPPPEPDRPEPEFVAAAEPLQAAPPSEAPIAETAARGQEAVDLLSPAGSPLPRQGVRETPEPAPLARERDEVDEVMADRSLQLQRLAELNLGDRPADAVAGTQDAPLAADNRPEDGGAQLQSVERSSQQSGRGAATITERSPDQLVEYSITDQSVGQAPVARRVADGAALPELYSLRARDDRVPLLERYGGTPQTEEAVTAALSWLAANQRPDGHWDAAQFGAGRETRALGHDRAGAGSNADSGITGLALLAFLGSGNSHFEGVYRLHVQRGLEFLLRIQKPNGSLAGSASLFARMYCHGIATLALSEAYALTGDRRLTPYVERAIGYTLVSQHSTTGGWRYQPGDRGDMSQFGWQVMALKSAELAGIEIPARTRAGMLRFLHSVSSGTHNGLASYRRGERTSRTMTAEALVCRYFLGRQHDSAAIGEATDFVLQQLPDDQQANLYYWYYGTLALFQVQGHAWQTWNQALQNQLLSRQRTSGRLAGSWDPDTVWGGYGGRVYTTAMATLCLEVYYRYLPVYEMAGP